MEALIQVDYSRQVYPIDANWTNWIREESCGYPANQSSTDHSSESNRELEQTLIRLSAVQAAVEFQFLSALAEFDRRGGWQGDGTLSCAHWLNWRCGLNLGAAREKVRVAHALADLPKISDAFSKGHLSYSKVRALTRIATPSIEKNLLNIAEHSTANQVEKLVRAYRRCESIEALENECDAANQRHYKRSMSYYHDEDGYLTIRARLPPELGAIVLKALQTATDALREDEQTVVPENADVSARDRTDGKNNLGDKEDKDSMEGTDSVARPDNPPRGVSAEMSDPVERHKARTADALALIARHWLDTGSLEQHSCDQSAADQQSSAEFSPEPDSPAPDTNNQNPPNKKHPSTKPSDHYQVVVIVDADTLENKITGSGLQDDSGNNAGTSECHLENGPTLPVETVRRISCDCSVVGVLMRDQQPLSIGRKARTIPSAIRRALERRDGGCTFPGCGATRFVEGHHILHWANGGETSLDNLTLLCSHHHHLLHEGGYCLERTDNGELAFYDKRGRLIDPRQPRIDDIDYNFYIHQMQDRGEPVS